jgi:molybdopterin converting factor small subunit
MNFRHRYHTWYRLKKGFFRIKILKNKKRNIKHIPILTNCFGGQFMKVKVQYLSLVKSYTNNTGHDEIELQDDALLSDLLNAIVAKYGEKFKKEVYTPGDEDVKDIFALMINGLFMASLKGIKTPLKNGDNVTIMSVMTGG